MNVPQFYHQRGFTLIELAIVLVIIGVLIGSFLGTLGARIDTTKRAETKDDLEVIKTALLGYAFSRVDSGKPHLPCPCTTDCDIDTANPQAGLQSGRVNGRCNVKFGFLPWGTLGLKPSDAWNSLYRYWVHPDFSDDGSAAVYAIDVCDSGSGEIRTRSPDGTETLMMASNVVAVVFTHGKNGYGGLSVDGVTRPVIPVANLDEDENDDGDSVFVSRTPTPRGATTAGGEFDDIVTWISDFELKARLAEMRMLATPSSCP
jgi:prepilin-type N-terminal cleavage/methylation domain-containing protein